MTCSAAWMGDPGKRRLDAAILGDGNDPRQDRGHRDVENGADSEGGDDSDGQVALRVPRLLGGGGDGVEADVGEEHHRGRPHHAGPAIGRVGRPVGGLNVRIANPQEDQNREQLDEDHDRVEAGALADADDQQDHHQKNDDDGGQIDHGSGQDPGARLHPGGKSDPSAQENPLEVSAPADGHGHGADRVFENQIPADHPGDDFAEGGVGVGVGAARDGNHRRELGVAQGRETAGEAGQDIGEGDRRARLVRGRGSGQDEDAGADDRADAEEREIEGGESSLQSLALVDVARESVPASSSEKCWLP